MILVLLALAALLYGALALARSTESSTLIAGNLAFRESAAQAADAGVADAYEQIGALADRETAAGGWYFPLQQAQDAAGVPQVNWSSARQLTVGPNTVQYVVERLCNGLLPLTNITQQCVVKQTATSSSAKAGEERIESPSSPVFRITVAVTGTKNTRTVVQATLVR